MVARLLERVQESTGRGYLVANRRLRGWPTLIYRSLLSFTYDEGPAMSAALAYYALVSFFPLLLLLIAVGTQALNPDQVREAAIRLVSRYMPGAIDGVTRTLEEILRQRTTVGAVALIGLLWASSGVFGAIYRAVNRAWGHRKPSPFWEGRLFALSMTVGIGLMFFLYMAVTITFTLIQSWRLPVLGWQVFLDPAVTQLLGWLSAVVSTLFTIAIFAVIYKVLPRSPVAWRDVWPGASAAGLAWQVARIGFTWYLGYVRYNLVYGSLGAIVAFLLWSYLSALILLVGAEFSAEYARWRRAGRPVDNRLPRQVREEWT